MAVNLSRIAYGCSSFAELDEAVARRAVDGELLLTTRNRPRRAAELVGGSLYWIVRHHWVARSPIVRFADADDGRTIIVLDTRLILVVPVPRRAHQGWRYLSEADSPRDLVTDGCDAIPPDLASELAGVGLF